MMTLLGIVADVILPGNLAIVHDGPGGSPRLRLSSWCSGCRKFHRGYLETPAHPSIVDFVIQFPDGCRSPLYAGKRVALMPDPDPSRLDEHRAVIVRFRREALDWKRARRGKDTLALDLAVVPDRPTHPWE